MSKSVTTVVVRPFLAAARLHRPILGLSAALALFVPAEAGATLLYFNGAVTGSLNGVAINASESVVGDTSNGFNTTTFGPFDPSIQYTAAWNYPAAHIAEMSGGALNCLALTGGNYTRHTTINFPTGEQLHETSVFRRLTATTFSMTSAIDGSAPAIPFGSHFERLDYDIHLNQLDHNTLRYTLNNSYLVDLNNDGVIDPVFTFTGTADLSYDGNVQLPFEEIQHARNLTTTFNPDGTIRFEQVGTISPVPGPGAMGCLLIAGAAASLRRRER